MTREGYRLSVQVDTDRQNRDSPDDEARSAGKIARAVDILARHPVATVFFVALVLRVGVAIGVYVLAGGYLFGDDNTYPLMAEQAATGESLHWDDFTRRLYESTATLTVPLTLLYRLVGPNPLLGQLLVALFGAAAAAGTAGVAHRFLGSRWALAAGLAVALLPSQILWSSLVLKDAPVWAMLALLALVVAWVPRRWSRWFLWAALLATGLFLLAHLRAHTTVVAAIAIALAVWFTKESGVRRYVRGSVGLVVAIAIPWLVGLGPLGLGLALDPGSLEGRRYWNALDAATAFIPEATSAQEREAVYEDLLETVENKEAQAEALRTEAMRVAAGEGAPPGDPQEPGRSGDAQVVAGALIAEARQLEREAEQVRQEAQAVAPPAPPAIHEADEAFTVRDLYHLPRGLSVMLLEPYPWLRYDNRRMQLAAVETVVWYPLVLLAGVGLFTLGRHRRYLMFPALVGGGILAMYSLAEGNFGTAYRHRGEFVWAVALLAAAGCHWLWSLRRKARVER